MKKLLLLILIFNLQLSIVNCQPSQIKRTWHWYFGSHAGIDFSSGTAVADTNGALVTSEGCASISDTAGNLQFYSDGRTVWNRNHQVMPHGTGIMGGANGSSTQAALIIPQPLSPNLYYLFTTDEDPGINGMRYTVIDMNLDGGNGDVDTTQKNILLFAPCTEKLAAVNHCNDTNVWVMGHEVNNNHFRAYLVTENGIDTNAVVTDIGHVNMNNFVAGLSGPIKFSPSGNKLCAVSDSNASRIELFDFDNYTGLVSNRITLLTNQILTIAISFSPDNSQLYIGNYNGLYQYNVSINDSTIILNSQIIIAQNLPWFRYMQNTFDGKIFIAKSPIDTVIMAIDNPNNSGLSCNLNQNELNVSRYFGGGLPGFNESYFNQSTSNGCTTGVSEIEKNFIKIFPNPARDWVVSEGRGIKSVEIINALGNGIDFYPTTASALRNSLNISSLSCGIYFLKINMIDEQFSFQKIIVQH